MMESPYAPLMKVKKIQVRQFKRFTDLTIEGLPDTARLVMLAGPNGSGKSSLFEAMHSWHRHSWKRTGGWDPGYHSKLQGDEAVRSWGNTGTVEFHGEPPTTDDQRRKAIYVRSAYRNDPEFQVGSLSRVESLLTETRVNRLIDNDAAVGRNYQRMASQGLEDVYERESADVTMGQFRERTIGEIRNSVLRLFPNLELNSLGNPLTHGTFRFTKGSAAGFLFKNLSGGEKAAFDLILDLIVARREYDDTVYCIDEPEAHMNARLQGELLSVLYSLVPKNCQLWLATHSIGMMRRARDISVEQPGTVAFIDFEDRDFDVVQVLEPVQPNRAFWQRAYTVALDDLAALVAPSRVIICEGATTAMGAKGNANLDSDCYNTIFEQEFPETKFLPGGNCSAVETDRLALMESIQALVSGAVVVRLIDRDDHSAVDVEEKRKQGIRVLTRRNIESYLYDDEVLTALCAEKGRPDVSPNLLDAKRDAVAAAIARGKPSDDAKAAAGEIFNAARKLLDITGGGNDPRTFMRATLAPLIKPGMKVYEDLYRDVFGERR